MHSQQNRAVEKSERAIATAHGNAAENLTFWLRLLLNINIELLNREEEEKDREQER